MRIPSEMKGKISIYSLLVFMLCMAQSCRQSATDRESYRSWEVYKGDAESTSYSRLDQINRENVDRLEVAWVYNSGDARNAGSQTNPIIVDGVMYLTTPGIKVAALNAATGEEKWLFDPFEGETATSVNRGVVYWEEGEDKRIFVTADRSLYALNAETGTPVPEFGEDGIVDLREGLGRDPTLMNIRATTPGIIHKNLLIMGHTPGESEGAGPGHIRAYNARTGEIEWIFHTIPYPGEFGYDTWSPDAWQLAGGANNWAGMSLDKEREIVFVPTGSPAPDFYSPGTRGEGKHLFGNTILALDANTGERIWHYQVVHHDLWDYDLPAPPNLVTVEHDGREIDAVAQITKQGLIFLLDRETGEPLFPIEERPVPPSTIEGEEAWPTQPIPVKPEPFARQFITEDALTNISPEARAYALKRFREMRYEGLYTPVGVQETFAYPGTMGGGEWGGAAFDPETGLLYVNANEIGVSHRMEKIEVASVDEENILVRGQLAYRANCASCHGTPGGREPSLYPSLTDVEDRLSESQVMEVVNNGQNAMPPFSALPEQKKEAIIAYLFNPEKAESVRSSGEETEGSGNFDYAIDFLYERFRDQNGHFATKPPWGTLNAVDLNSGEIAWKVPLGTYEDLADQGITDTGTFNLGGPVVTAGGLVFIGAAADEKFRAFDKQTGEILWEYQLPAVGYATPSTYEIDGRQYVVIAATGGSRLGTHKSDAFIAFALPKEQSQQ
ncbi:MAG: pyrroloquinoline quinone-dependent dehydrogenase [Balneolaceae bacterium]|nr:pyrroloquinoline quinone-dependent dehydrogenase [Balneolaceae bacterium]